MHMMQRKVLHKMIFAGMLPGRMQPRETLWIGQSAVWRNILIRWHCISSVKIKAQRRILDHCHFGGGCINDTIIHLATSAMPFGGVGESGMGGYHGRAGFETFSHYRSIVDKKTWTDLPIRYQRYDEMKEKMLRRFLK